LWTRCTSEISGCHNDAQQNAINATWKKPIQASSGSKCWVLVQQNDGTDQLFFNRKWDIYSQGFGDASGNFWIGNEHLHEMTQVLNEGLHFDVCRDAVYNTLSVTLMLGNTVMVVE